MSERPERITAWKARRAGGRITIVGKDEAGDPIKIVGVDTIEAAQPHPLATDRNGDRFELA